MGTDTDRHANGPALAELGSAWERLVVALRRAQSRGGDADGAGLSLSQYQLVRALAGTSGLPPGQLAERAGIAPPTATKMLDGLERDGIVQRSRGVRDRRAVSVRLTAEGRRRLVDKHERIAEHHRWLFADLSDAQRAELERLMHRLTDIIGQL